MGDAPRADKALAPLLVATTLALGWVLLPFYGCLLWGAIVALLFAPLQRRLVPRLRGRRTPAALLTPAARGGDRDRAVRAGQRGAGA